MFPWNTLFSSHKNQNNFLKNFQHHDVQSLIEKVFAEVMPENIHDLMNQKTASQETASQTKDQPLQAHILETHSFLYIRIPIKDESWLKQMKLVHTSNQCIVHDVPNEQDQHIITLPTLVRKKGTTVQYKDHILEIRLQKQNEMSYSEIDVSEL